MKSTTVYQYRLRLPKTSWDQATTVRTEAARLWNRMVKLHAWFRKRQLKWPACGDFERHFKGRFALYSQTVQAIIQKFFAHIDGARTHRQNGNESARYPHRSQTCPACGAQHKPSGRRYVCDCGYTGVRDEVGAANLLNHHLNGKIVPNTVIPTGHIRYLRPARLKTKRSVVAPLIPATLLAWPGKGFASSRDRSPTVASSRIPRL